MKFRLLAVVAFAATALSCCPAGARPLQISDSRRIVNVEEPAIARDGRRVAFISITPDYAHATYVHDLWIANVATGKVSLVFHGHDVCVPRWSPDGNVLAFLIRPSTGEHYQLVVRKDDTTAHVVTHAVNDVEDFAWRPDGAEIAFAAYDAPSTRDYFEVSDNDYAQTVPTPPVHLWLWSNHGNSAKRLTHGSWSIAPTDPGGIFTSQFAWSSDERRLLYTRVEDTNVGDDEYSTIHSIDVTTGAAQKITANPHYELTPMPSLGGAMAYWYPQDGAYLAQNTLHLLRDGRDTIVSRNLDRNIGGALWMPGARAFLTCGDDGPHATAWKIGIDGTVAIVPLGKLNITCDSYSSSTFDSGIAASVAPNGGVAFVATDPTHARELYYIHAIGDRPKQITHFNDWLRHIQIGRMTQYHWTGPNGEPENGVLTFPPVMTGDKRYPLVVFPHGGPGLASIDEFVWESWPEAQLLASRGFIVFQPNYRGGDDHGNRYMTAIYRDTVRGPSADIMSGVAAVKNLPRVDPERVALCGWSYGGLLTSWLATQNHDWKAAISGAAVNDEIEEYNLSVTNVQNRYYLGARPYVGNGMKIYIDQSPITYATQITTPMLIWSTTGDTVVPTTMSYSMYRALLDNHRTVKFVQFNASSHGPSTPVNTEELTGLWLDWLEKYLR